MLPKAHLTSHSRMSGSRSVITTLLLSGSWRSFFLFFCVFLLCLLNVVCYIFLYGLPRCLSGKKIPLSRQEMQEMWVQSLGREDTLERKMATHCSILAWRISWIEEPGRLLSLGLQRVRHDWSNLACCISMYMSHYTHNICSQCPLSSVSSHCHRSFLMMGTSCFPKA